MLRRHFCRCAGLVSPLSQSNHLIASRLHSDFLEARHTCAIHRSQGRFGLGCSCLFSRLELSIDDQKQNDDIPMENTGLVRLKLTAGRAIWMNLVTILALEI